jgi:hypothetical protein
MEEMTNVHAACSTCPFSAFCLTESWTEYTHEVHKIVIRACHYCGEAAIHVRETWAASPDNPIASRMLTAGTVVHEVHDDGKLRRWPREQCPRMKQIQADPCMTCDAGPCMAHARERAINENITNYYESKKRRGL